MKNWEKEPIPFDSNGLRRRWRIFPHLSQSIRRRPKIIFFAFFVSFIFRFLVLVTIEIRQTFSITQNAFVNTYTHEVQAHTHTPYPVIHSAQFIVAGSMAVVWVWALGCMGARVYAPHVCASLYLCANAVYSIYCRRCMCECIEYEHRTAKAGTISYGLW